MNDDLSQWPALIWHPWAWKKFTHKTAQLSSDHCRNTCEKKLYFLVQSVLIYIRSPVGHWGPGLVSELFCSVRHAGTEVTTLCCPRTFTLLLCAMGWTHVYLFIYLVIHSSTRETVEESQDKTHTQTPSHALFPHSKVTFHSSADEWGTKEHSDSNEKER